MRQVLAAGDPVLAPEEAVVGGEDDVGVVDQPLLGELGDDVPDGLVHREQLLQAPPPLRGDRLLQCLPEPLAGLLLQPLRLV